MYLFTLLQLIEDELQCNDGKISEGFLQKIRDIGLVKQYATTNMDIATTVSLDDCPQYEEDLGKIKTIKDLYDLIQRLKVFFDENISKDV